MKVLAFSVLCLGISQLMVLWRICEHRTALEELTKSVAEAEQENYVALKRIADLEGKI